MNKGKALRIILIEWALAYYADGSENCIYELFEEVDLSTDFGKAITIWFVTHYPNEKEIEKFAKKEKGFMMGIYDNMTDLILGEISIDTVMINKTIGDLYDE